MFFFLEKKKFWYSDQGQLSDHIRSFMGTVLTKGYLFADILPSTLSKGAENLSRIKKSHHCNRNIK